MARKFFFFMKNTKFSNSEVDGPTGAAFKGQFTVCKYLLIIIFHLMY